jgi:hypothetical protein
MDAPMECGGTSAVSPHMRDKDVDFW